jgi:hypothetical protein
MRPTLAQLDQKYRRLAEQLAKLGYITQGSVFERRKGPGSRYQWTWKNKNQKTESLTLTADQFQWLKKASHNQRRLTQLLSQMRRLSEQIFRCAFAAEKKKQPPRQQRSTR